MSCWLIAGPHMGIWGGLVFVQGYLSVALKVLFLLPKHLQCFFYTGTWTKNPALPQSPTAWATATPLHCKIIINSTLFPPQIKRKVFDGFKMWPLGAPTWQEEIRYLPSCISISTLLVFSSSYVYYCYITAQLKLCKIQVNKWSNERNQREESWQYKWKQSNAEGLEGKYWIQDGKFKPWKGWEGKQGAL